MLLEINYTGNEYNTDPVDKDDLKLMAVDRQTQQLIENLGDGGTGGSCGECPVFTMVVMADEDGEDGEDQMSFTCDKTYEEIKAAILAHKLINAYFSSPVKEDVMRIWGFFKGDEELGSVDRIEAYFDGATVLFLEDGSIVYDGGNPPGGDGGSDVNVA